MTFEDLKKANPSWTIPEIEAAYIGYTTAKNSVKCKVAYSLIEDNYSIINGGDSLEILEFESQKEAENWVIKQGYSLIKYQ